MTLKSHYEYHLANQLGSEPCPYCLGIDTATNEGNTKELKKYIPALAAATIVYSMWDKKLILALLGLGIYFYRKENK